VIKNQHIVGKRKQRGAALILFVLIMMGFGAVAMTGLLTNKLSEIESNRFNHNKRVLEEAKQALLMYAYNYPNISHPWLPNQPYGPGRLPCPDADNNGLIGKGALGAQTVNAAECNKVGRFPWDEGSLNFYAAQDASGETLWYAVSKEFRDTAPTDIIVNSESGSGKDNITIIDQSGTIQYRGDVNGVAAVIIAPGPPINRDINGDGSYDTAQNRAADRNEPKNYLDTFNDFDNSVFNSGQSATDEDGFILGPISEPDPDSPAENLVVVNDQFIVVRAEEVIAMAEKATLQAYRNAINDYRDNVGTSHFPWLAPYNSAVSYCEGEIPDGETTQAGCLAALTPGTWISGLGIPNADVTPKISDPVIGRVPSLFGRYFEGDSAAGIDSKLGVSLSIEANSTIDTAWGGFSIGSATIQPMEFEKELINVGFVDGDLTAEVDVGPAESFTFNRFFYAAAHKGPGDATWTLCGNDLTDCPQGGTESSVLRVKFTFDFNPGDILSFDMSSDPVSMVPTAATSTTHSQMEFTFSTIPSAMPVTIEYEYDQHYKPYQGDTVASPGQALIGSGPQDISDFTFGPFTLDVRYYPELPVWAWENEWHNSILMAYSSAFQPDGDLGCTPQPSPITSPNDYCLDLMNSGGITNNKAAILVLSGADEDGDAYDRMVDEDGNGFSDDLVDIFEGENSTDALPYGGDYGALKDNLTFDRKPDNGNDVILILE
jgi:hypothetical protein